MCIWEAGTTAQEQISACIRNDLAMMAGFQNLWQVEEITIPEDGNDDNNIALLGKFLIQVSLLSFFCMTISIS